jgi:hypothetical protein
MRLRLALLVMVVGIVVRIAPSAAAPARAGETWCFDDPLIAVGGSLVDIQVQLPLDQLVTMRTTTLTITIPQNVAGAVLVDDVSAFPMHTTVVAIGPLWTGSGALPITITATVVSASSFPMRVVATPLLAPGVPLAPPTTATGVSNTPLTMPMALGR